MIYIVKLVMSSENRIEGREEVDDTTVTVHYTFPKLVRSEISAIRSRARRRLAEKTLDFYGLRIAKEENLQEIRNIAEEADRELKQIHESLYAYMVSIPIDVSSVKKGELYDKVLNAIKFQVYSTVFQRIKDMKLKHVMNKKVKESLLRMINTLKAVNVLNDPEIDKSLKEIEMRILENDVTTIREEVKKQLQKLTKSRAAYIQPY